MSESPDVTKMLRAASAGDHEVADRLFAAVYDQLHLLADRQFRQERAAHTLQPTALVHQAYLALVGDKKLNYRARTHFFATAAKVMRQLLVDHARSRSRQKRGGVDRRQVPLQDDMLTVTRDEDIIAVEETLTKLERIDARQAAIVELRFYGGLTVEEVAVALKISKRTVEAEWTMIRAWLRRELSGDLN